ncbi:MAG: BlaI/MecI/CopY family transcriptional regulator [Pirellulales bacterium]|nr:BlaI/MecI/CopY family transcriptional regulator [Pirellulales bacterium]
MARRPALSKAEMEIARLLWELGEATVREVHEALPRRRKINFTTVQTYLRRLEAKGYARSELQGRTLVYTARVRPETVIRETVDDMVERLFDGQSLPLVQHLIEERGMDAMEINQLRELLDRLEEEGHDAHGK